MDCSFLPWFCIVQALTWFSLTIVDVGSFLPGFYFFGFLCLGGSGVLSHGAVFLFILRNIDVELDIGTLCCT